MDELNKKLFFDGFTFCLKCGHQIADGEKLEHHQKYCNGDEKDPP
jgi:hypothetical protein